jgi:hypothetical protein
MTSWIVTGLLYLISTGLFGRLEGDMPPERLQEVGRDHRWPAALAIPLNR